MKKNQSETNTKSSFELWLKARIKDEIRGIDLKKVSYDGDKTAITKILLLFNVLTLNELTDIPQNRFSFNRYKNMKGGSSIEHIHAQNSENIKDIKQIKIWLDKTKDVLSNIRSVEKTSDMEKTEISIKEYLEKIDDLLRSISNNEDNNEIVTDFNVLNQRLSEVFDSRSVHDLSNLALIGNNDNSKLNNFIFPVKRNIIIDLEKKGHFVPLCTKMVFLKGYSNTDYQPFYWSEIDKNAYFSEIERIIKTIKT